MEDIIKWLNRLQRQVDGLIKPEVGRWIDWTPTVSQGVAVTVTVNFARYIVIGNTVIMQVFLSVTGAGVAGNVIIISGIPTAIQPTNFTGNNNTIGGLIIQDSGTAFYHGGLVAVGANDLRIITDNQTNFVGITPNFALANTDTISFCATYER